MTTLNQRRTKRPGNRENIERIKAEMHRDTQLYRLRALREELGVTQVSLAGKIGVGQNRISQIEHGNISSARVETLQKYLQALNADLEIYVKRADGTRVPLDFNTNAS